MQQPKGIAVFDMDGTITAKDTFLEFLKYSNGSWGLWRCMILNMPFIVLYYLKLYPNHKLKERFFSFFFKGKDAEAIKTLGQAFSRDVLPGLCYQSALDIIDKHKSKGHDVYILTASSDVWLNNWCKNNGLHLMATVFEVKHGLYTGKIEGANCYGYEKARRLKPLLEDGGYNISYGYGDSLSDKYFLALVQKPFLMKLTSENAGKILLEI